MDEIAELQTRLLIEFRAIFDDVRRERQEIFSIVIENVDIVTLHRIADRLEAHRVVTVAASLNPGVATGDGNIAALIN